MCTDKKNYEHVPFDYMFGGLECVSHISSCNLYKVTTEYILHTMLCDTRNLVFQSDSNLASAIQTLSILPIPPSL